MLGNGKVWFLCVCVHTCVRFTWKCQEKRVLRKRQGEKKKTMSESSIFIMFCVSAIYLYNGQGAQMEGRGPGSWEAQHHYPIAHSNAPFPRAPAALFPAQLLSEF